MVEVLQDIMQEIEDVIDKVKDEELQAVMAELDKSRRVFVAGEGRSGFSARGFAMRLMHIGYTVYFVGETITPAMQAGDVFIGVSGSGKSASVVNDAKKAKDAGLTVIAVTSKPESPLAEAAKTVLVCFCGCFVCALPASQQKRPYSKRNSHKSTLVKGIFTALRRKKE